MFVLNSILYTIFEDSKDYIVKKPWIQVSVDTLTLPEALVHVEHARAIEAEWVEVGTPLLNFVGIDAIASVAQAAPGHSIVADFKALDGVEQYFIRAGQLGASVATVMAVANEASIEKAISVGHQHGVKIQVDLLNVPKEDLPRRVQELSQMGADYFLLHLAIDEHLRNPHADPLDGLDEVVAATDRPVGPVVFTNEQGVDAIHRGASYVVIGYPLILEENAREQLQSFANAVRTVAVPG